MSKARVKRARKAAASPASPSPSARSSASRGKRNARGETPLHTACIDGDVAKVTALLEDAAALVNEKDNAGWTALHEACNNGHVKVVKLLLQANADVNIPGFENDTPLHDAVVNGHAQVAKVLLAHGADPHARNHMGKTPLDLAAGSSLEELFKNAPPASPRAPALAVPPSTELGDGEPVILTTTLGSHKEACRKALEKLDADARKEFAPDVTHVVTSIDKKGRCSRTIKYMLGVVSGCWILDSKWLEESAKAQEFVDPSPFEVKGDTHALGAPKKSRTNRLGQRPGLFDGCSFFYRHEASARVPKEQIEELIKAGGGQVLHRPPKSSWLDDPRAVAYHAAEDQPLTTFVLYASDDAHRLPGLSENVGQATVDWLFDCVSNFRLLRCPTSA
eukprot:m.87342 g.87342  ORF g.87342 m.87342 type:complete len:391 (+) comp8460_c0_seq4:1250-2422(+)